MKKKIVLLYFLTLFLVFVFIHAWEFWFESMIQPLLTPDYFPESVEQRWEYVKTVVILCAIALILPAILSLKIEERRQAALDALDVLHKKTKQLLEERTVELTTAKEKLKNQPNRSDSENNNSSQITLQKLMDSISDTILVIDMDYQVRMLNQAARDMHFKGLQPSSSLTCHKLSHGEDKPCSGPEHECPFKKVMESGKSTTVFHYHVNNRGDKIPCEILASPIRDDHGNIVGIIELARDVSSRLVREQKQRDADARLLDLQRQQSITTLAGGLAHEFNNILTSILGNAELLSVRLDEHDINKKQAEAIIAGSEQLADLTKQILAYAKGGKYLNQSISVNTQINDSLHLIRAEKFGEAEVELDLGGDLWPVQGDPAQINQLIMNIIINGLEALEKTRGKLIIRTANETKKEKWKCSANNIHPPGDYVLFSVTNTGTISEELMTKIFDPFFSTKFTGRGMGLAAAKGIVHNHDGCISVECHSEQTTFLVLLPRAISDAEINKNDKKSSKDLLNLKVLVVDDEPQVLSIIKSLLDHHGCDVLCANKGKEALEIVERHKADLDLVILDIQMPDMTGDKVYSRLKKIKPDLKVLISSGYEQYTALKNIMLDPMDKFMKKPFRMSDLMLKIKEVMVQ